jgi:uncharacterized protein YbcI
MPIAASAIAAIAISRNPYYGNNYCCNPYCAMLSRLSQLPPVTEAESVATHGHPTREQPGGNLSRDVSGAMVKLLKDYIGRGASDARTYIREGLVVVVLRGTMTKAERTLADAGEEGLVRGVRQALRGKFLEEANGIVERLTGQRVCAFLSDHDVDQDIVFQAFVLEPGPSRSPAKVP